MTRATTTLTRAGWRCFDERRVAAGFKGTLLRWKKKLVVRYGNEKALRVWVCALATDLAQAFPGKGAMKPEAAEIDRSKNEAPKLRI